MLQLRERRRRTGQRDGQADERARPLLHRLRVGAGHETADEFRRSGARHVRDLREHIVRRDVRSQHPAGNGDDHEQERRQRQDRVEGERGREVRCIDAAPLRCHGAQEADGG